jgi:GNAT superfamily N-acetyltransferase
MKSYIEFLNENNKVFDLNKISYDIQISEYNEDTIEIEADYENQTIAKLIMEYFFEGYWYVDDALSEDQYKELFPDDTYAAIHRIDVYNYRQSGVGRALMQKALDKIKSDGYNRVYLNASPLGYGGASLNDLVRFYKSFGFEEILHQGNNVQMILKIK